MRFLPSEYYPSVHFDVKYGLRKLLRLTVHCKKVLHCLKKSCNVVQAMRYWKNSYNNSTSAVKVLIAYGSMLLRRHTSEHMDNLINTYINILVILSNIITLRRLSLFKRNGISLLCI